MRTCTLIALLFPFHALAQEGSDDPQRDLESRINSLADPDVEQEKRIEARGSLESQWHDFNNIDYRLRDESSDQAILDSDDRGTFAFSGVSVELSVKIDEQTTVVGGLSHRGLWGDDQLGKANAFQSAFYFTSLYMQHSFGEGMELRIGRQLLELGGIANSREYVLSDIVDMVRLDVPLGEAGTIMFIPINVVGLAPDDDVSLVRYIGQSNTTQVGFRGDTMHRRHGAILNLDGLGEGAPELHAYAFYTDIGSPGSGSDISYQGRLGNFADNDWVANIGVRGQLEAGAAIPFLSADISRGIDRKELVADDVNANGISGSAGIVVDTRDKEEDNPTGFMAEFSGYYAQGAVYRANGLQFSHGYVGLKGRHTGGTIANRYLGLHPAAYVGRAGVTDEQHSYGRKSGTLVGHAYAGYDFGKVNGRVAYWYMQDTAVTALNLSELDTIDPPFGYSRDEFAAQERLGKALGQEINVDVRWDLGDAVTLRMNTGVFLPGAFYAIPIGRVAGPALGGETPAWTVNAGSVVRF